jgi:hypothetical protein
VITAKPEPTARLSLDSVGLAADELFGDAHGPEKAAVLAALGAAVYVGDTPADMLAAVTANVRGVGVATGSFSASELRAAGAAHVLHSLDGFPALYASLAARGLQHGAYNTGLTAKPRSGRGATRPPRALDRPRPGQHLARGLLRHQRPEGLGVQRHPARQVLARQVQVEHGDPERVLLHREGLVGQNLDLHRPVAELGVLLDHDARQRVVPHDELPTQVAKPDSLLTHDLTPFSERSC